MKLCQTCQIITSDEKKYCAYDGQPLVADPLATALQESVSAKYTVARLIGTGSMGAVYRARHHALGDVAIKVMLGPPDNHKLSERFLREAKALRKLNNPHSVLVYDLERSTTGLTYMVMEMVEGRSLRDELKERGHLPLEEAIEVAEAVCDALEEAHEQGIIHRDLKPDNILLAEERETDTDGDVSRLIKIVDFGIAKLRGTQQGGEEVSMQLTKYGTPIGTPFYMSPEQWFGDGPGYTALDGRTDIYALGCTLYEALAGYPPFSGNTKEELRSKHLNEQPRPLNEVAMHVPESVSRVILRTLEKDRDFRPASAAEFVTELVRAFEESAPRTIDKKERGRPRLTSESSESAEARPEPTSPLQTTEESVPVVRNWAAGEAQAAMEKVREQPIAILQARESQALRQVEAEAAAGQSPFQPPLEVGELEETLEPGAYRFENGQLKPEQHASPSVESEYQRTLKLDAARSREACELLLAQAGAWHIGLFAEEVESIAEWRSPAPLPHAPPAVLGVVNVHGRMLTVIDPAALLGEGNAEKTEAAPAFIIALRGDEQLALAVNRVGAAIGIFSTEIELPAQATGVNIMRGIVQGAHGQTVVLDPRELFAAAMQGAERRRRRM
jgi:serine/threonine protein kinase/chemotaxis signal transduction protein